MTGRVRALTRQLREVLKPRVVGRKVTAYYQPDSGEWWVLWPDGTVEVAVEPEDVIKRVRKADADLAKKHKKDAIIFVTSLDWEDVPPGFKPPK
jgi:hypothetical protein